MTPQQLRLLAQANDDTAEFIDSQDPSAAIAFREAARYGRQAAVELAEEIERVV